MKNKFVEKITDSIKNFETYQKLFKEIDEDIKKKASGKLKTKSNRNAQPKPKKRN